MSFQLPKIHGRMDWFWNSQVEVKKSNRKGKGEQEDYIGGSLNKS